MLEAGLIMCMRKRSVTVDEFRVSYPPCEPRRVGYHDPREWIALPCLARLHRAPASGVMTGGEPPRYRDGPTVHRYIWVIDSTGIPYILEFGQSTPAGHVPKHSNLTGGMPASMGGEMWFETRCSLFLSGGSGRYPPRNEQQLADAATVFEDYGYAVCSLGWEDGAPRRYLI